MSPCRGHRRQGCTLGPEVAGKPFRQQLRKLKQPVLVLVRVYVCRLNFSGTALDDRTEPPKFQGPEIYELSEQVLKKFLK